MLTLPTTVWRCKSENSAPKTIKRCLLSPCSKEKKSILLQTHKATTRSKYHTTLKCERCGMVDTYLRRLEHRYPIHVPFLLLIFCLHLRKSVTFCFWHHLLQCVWFHLGHSHNRWGKAVPAFASNRLKSWNQRSSQRSLKTGKNWPSTHPNRYSIAIQSLSSRYASRYFENNGRRSEPEAQAKIN